MNPYYKLLEDVLALFQTTQFAQVIVDIRAIEGGGGTHLTTDNAHTALRQAIALAQDIPQNQPPASVPGPHPNPTSRNVG